MLLREMIQQLTKEEIQQTWKFLYPTEYNENIQKAIDRMWHQLVAETPADNKEKMTIHVTFEQDGASKDKTWSASFSLSHRYEKKYALSLTSLPNILNAEVFIDDLKTPAIYMTRILWELIHDDWEEEGFSHTEEDLKYYKKEDILASIDEIED